MGIIIYSTFEHPALSNGTMVEKKKDVDEHPTQSSATRAGTP
jgi:hypothetical protein